MQARATSTSSFRSIARAVDRVDEIKRASAMVRRLVKDENADRVSDETLLREMKRVLALLEDLEHSAKYAVVQAAREAVQEP